MNERLLPMVKHVIPLCRISYRTPCLCVFWILFYSLFGAHVEGDYDDSAGEKLPAVQRNQMGANRRSSEASRLIPCPAGATFVTTSNPDGSPQSISGTGQRAQQYSYDINGKNIATTVRLMNNTILSQDIVNGFGQTVVQAEPNTLGGFIYTRSEYNAKGQSLSSAQKQLISQLNSTLEGKIISVNERNLTSENWTVYNEATKRLQYSTAPTSAITAETVMVGGFALLQEVAGEITGYQANALNQYAMLSVDDIADFIPSYDAAGNQTRVKTSTGIWAISYDAENRPTDFTSQAVDGTITTVHCEYDYMGRRATKKVTTNGSITLHQRYIYRGYLQIAALDLTRAAHPALWYITWDPTQPVATRPLATQKDGTWYTYGWDLTKNICELYGQHGYLRTAYTYSPYGKVTAEGDVEQAILWSSEFNDNELGLVYYNYRHYNPVDGRWTGRDRVIRLNHYVQGMNNCISNCDYLGQFEYASSDVEYVFDEGVDPRWKQKVAAVTDTYFPKINATKVKYEKKKGCTQIVFPNQQYIPKIICYKGAKCNERMMDKFIPNSKDQSLRKHELHHTSITSSYWNSFVNETKMIEMLLYRTKKEAQVAFKYVVWLHTLLNNQNLMENVQFDLSEYALHGEPEMRNDFQNKILQYSCKIAEAEKRIEEEKLRERTYNMYY